MDLGEVHVDPVHDEFFKAQDLADALVRESIQNSLDARLPRSRSPVSVRFRFASGAQALPAEGVREYFEGLEGHLRAAAKSIHTVLPRDDEAVPYLLIEDSGTRGLTGDPRADPELELSPERVTDSVVRQYFYPILRGDLIVDVIDAARSLRIDAETIENLSINNDSAARLCALTRWSLAQNDDARIVLLERDAAAPKWDESILDAATLASLRERFSSGERIAFRVPILVKRKRVRAASSWFDVYLEHDDALRKSEHRFIRRGITIPDVRVSTEKAARALIVIDDQALSTFLGDAENPAHTDWSERADKVRTLYDHGPSTLRFVKNSASFLTSLLSRPPAGRVRDLLADLFSIDVPEESLHDDVMAPAPIRAAAGESKPGTASTDAAPGSGGVTIARIDGGFTIKASDPAMVGRPLRGEIAYRVRAGNPFRKHSPFDFDLTSDGGITVQADGVRLRPTSVNAFELVPSAAKFLVSMKGFDPRRDLVVRLHDPLHDPDNAAETELH